MSRRRCSVELLARYLDPSCTFWTSLENKPISAVSGMLQKRRGVRSGVPDVLALFRRDTGIIVIFIELKSRRGVASKVQKQVRLELLPCGARWWMARSARAALMALHLSGVAFRRKWQPPQLKPWEGPFADPTQRLPQEPRVAAERATARKRWRKRQRAQVAKLRRSATPPQALISPQRKSFDRESRSGPSARTSCR
jgi:hypothetical protein